VADLSDLEKRVLRDLAVSEAKYEKKVAIALRDALDKMRAEMQRIYDKYAVDGLLTKAEMTKYMRYASMEKQMLAALDPALQKTLITIKRLTPEQYEEAFFRYAWAMDNATGLRLSWGMLNLDSLRASFKVSDLANKEMAEALKNYTMSARRKIRQALLDGLAQGKSYQDMARNLKEALNKTYLDAMRIMRTEGQSAQNEAQYDVYLRAEEQGIQGGRVWSATLDERTRDMHAAMDGNTPDSDGLYRLPNGETAPYPSWDGLSAENRINCRCSERFEIEGYGPQLRRTRDQGVIPYQTYEEWIKEYGPTVR